MLCTVKGQLLRYEAMAENVRSEDYAYINKKTQLVRRMCVRTKTVINGISQAMPSEHNLKTDKYTTNR